MGFDGLIIRRLSTLYAPSLVGARINKIGKLNKTDFIFLLFKEHQFNLVVSLDSNSPHLNIDNNKYSFTKDVNHFLSILKMHLEGGLITSFAQLGLDRIFKVEVTLTDETGAKTSKYLFIEFTGKRLNLILTKDNLKIIETYSKESVETSSRLLFAGSVYQPPTSSSLKDPAVDTYDMSLLPSEQFVGISPLIEKEVLALKLDALGFKQFINNLLTSSNLYLGTVNNKKDYHLLPLTIFHQESIKKFTIAEGLTSYYNSLTNKKESSELASNLIRIIKQQIKRLNTRLERLTQDLESASKFETYKTFGDLIYTYGKDQKSGLKEIELTNPTTDLKVKITLDPKISLFKNAERYFLKYHKAKNSIVILKEQIEQVNQEIDNLEYLLVAANDADETTLTQIQTELISKKYLLLKAVNKKKKEEKIKIKEYFTNSGVKISLGKSNLQNDYLTFKIAKNFEYFFHVKDYAGAHVIAHTDTLTDEVILFAANLAAYHSKARNAANVAVNYCQVKNIKKPKNYTPGLVIISNFKTVNVTPLKPD